MGYRCCDGECAERIAKLEGERESTKRAFTELLKINGALHRNVRGALGSHAHDGLSLAENVAELVRRVTTLEGALEADERLRTCGQHPTLGDVTMAGSQACGRVLPAGELYRCADCRTAFCRDCLRRHFTSKPPDDSWDSGEPAAGPAE